MTLTWERTPVAPEIGAALYMDAVLSPHRSLSAGAFKIMLIGMIAANAAVATFFWVQGAFPVAGFLGLDVLALFLAFRLNYHAARRVERVRIAREKVHVSSVDASGAEKHWVLNPVWARVVREGAGVLIRAGRTQIRLGAFLSPEECAAFAQALDAALYRAKRGGLEAEHVVHAIEAGRIVRDPKRRCERAVGEYGAIHGAVAEGDDLALRDECNAVVANNAAAAR
jgi:uncharacterized membrane protein